MSHETRRRRLCPKRSSFVWILLLGLVPWGARDASAAEPAERALDRAFLWRVADAEGREAWLLGSIHLADESIYPLPEAVEEAFAASEVLAVEADLSRLDVTEMQQMMMRAAADPQGRRLSERLPTELYRETAKRLSSLGLDIRHMEPMRPAFVALTIAALSMQEIGLTLEHGIEHHFLRRAGSRPVVELEGADYQLRLLSSFGDELEVLFLRHTLLDTEDPRDQAGHLLDAWRRGDEAAIEGLRAELVREAPELAPIDELIFTRRNLEMAEKIARYLESGKRHFVIVGAGHMVGDDGIPALLEQRGLAVERMSSVSPSPDPSVPTAPSAVAHDQID